MWRRRWWHRVLSAGWMPPIRQFHTIVALSPSLDITHDTPTSTQTIKCATKNSRPSQHDATQFSTFSLSFPSETKMQDNGTVNLITVLLKLHPPLITESPHEMNYFGYASGLAFILHQISVVPLSRRVSSIRTSISGFVRNFHVEMMHVEFMESDIVHTRWPMAGIDRSIGVDAKCKYLM